ncbi:MAG: GAF domain-containing protein [Anaerolineales bacterium]|nr:GAF domain-containing protein [Anaerolineales bacterium]
MGTKEIKQPSVEVIADVESNAKILINKVLRPAGIEVLQGSSAEKKPDLLIVDITRMMGDPLGNLRSKRASGDNTPAIILAAHFPPSRMRDLFRLGVTDILHKPFRPEELNKAIREGIKIQSGENDTADLKRRLKAAMEIARQRSEEIRLISEIGRVVVNLPDLEQILTRVVEAAAYVSNADEANIYLVDPNTNELVLRASKQASIPEATLQRLRSSESLVREVFDTGQPVLRQPSPEEGPVEIQTGFSVYSLIKVPIHVSNQIIGVLGVYNRVVANPFSEYQLTLIMTLADWAGVALEHASLRKQSQMEKEIQGVPPDQVPVQQMLISINTLLSSALGPLTDAQQREISKLKQDLSQFHDKPVDTTITLPSQELVDLHSILREVSVALQDGALQRGLELSYLSEKTIPLFPGNRSQIRRILLILASAALRRTTRGRIQLESHYVSVVNGASSDFDLPNDIHFPDGVWAILSVADTSSGLPPEMIHALRTPTGDLSAASFHVGFSIGEARMIAESMGGGLWFDETDQGTIIHLALPVKRLE